MEKRFLGVGWAFPPRVESDGAFATVSEEDDIKEAIRIILETAPGERPMRPEFGCGINEYVFGVINGVTLGQIGSEVRRALTLFEPRILLERVEVSAREAESGRLLIEIDYTVKRSNSRQNMVYPFYLKERG
ncbi:GPW/gp25 family protein [Hydrogenimonas sp.]